MRKGGIPLSGKQSGFSYKRFGRLINVLRTYLFRLRVERLLVAPSGVVRATITRTLAGAPAKAELVLLEGARAVARAGADLEGAAGSTVRVELALGEGTAGRLELALRVDDSELERQTVSVAADADGRLARIREAIGKLDPSAVRAPAPSPP